MADWTQEEDAELIRLWMAGMKTRPIGMCMGKTHNAVIGRAGRLAEKGLLTRRPSPIKGPMGPKAKPVYGAAAYVLARQTAQMAPANPPHGVEIIRKPRFWDMRSPDKPQAPADTLTLDVHDTTTREREYRNVAADKRYKLPIPVGAVGRARTCQWPTSDRRPWTFCGCDSQPGYSYCAGHKAVAFRSYVQGDAA